jgi:hypothetical protein
MTKADTKSSRLSAIGRPEPSDASDNLLLEAALRRYGPEAVREIVNGLQTIRYGSILLTVHEGQVVEISTTVKIRPSSVSDVNRQ